jgi:2-keto-4-pentenoate hydratase/2-oxohepta-3-ene-1,7-dioic acid hydratase in catechol pathway
MSVYNNNIKIMNFISFLNNNEERFGIVFNNKVTDLTGQINNIKSLKELIQFNCLEEGRSYAKNNPGDIDINSIKLLPVIPNPSKIICVGLNYHEHVKETEKTIADNPVTFQRFNDSQVAHMENMIIPKASDNLDFEGEMALIMKDSESHLSEDDALKYIAGYSCYNDGSVRDWQRHTKSTFGMGKNFKKTGSFGPHMVLAQDIDDYKQLTIKTYLNGEVMQSASLSQLIFDLPFLISYVSKALPWRAGDVLVTGTPGGVGFKRNPPIYLKEGDKVDITISEIGTLSNTLQNEVL